MSEWRDITSAPDDGVILVYFGNYQFRDVHGNPSSLGPVREAAERISVAYCVDGIIHECGTGHDMFEPWRGPELLPTKWRPVEPPA